VIGGMTGVLLAVPPADFVLHNSLFLIAHFHNVIIGGVVFGLFAGINYWFPKAFGFKLDAFWGKVSFWCWLVGFWVAFAPLYVLGLMGVTRRISHFDDASLQIWFQVAAVGAGIVALGIAAFLMQLWVSWRNRAALRDVTGDPWQGRTLEWSTASPPPDYNFAFTPVVHDVHPGKLFGMTVDYPLLAAGLAEVLEYLMALRFTPEALRWLESLGRFEPAFLDSLAKLRFTGEVWAMP